MTKADDNAAAIHRVRISNLRRWIAGHLPSLSNDELHVARGDAIEDAATFMGDLPWLDLVEAEFQRRGLTLGACSGT